MSDNVIIFPGETLKDLTPEQVLQKIQRHIESIETLICIIETKDKRLQWESSIASYAEINLLLDQVKVDVVEGEERFIGAIDDDEE